MASNTTNNIPEGPSQDHNDSSASANETAPLQENVPPRDETPDFERPPAAARRRAATDSHRPPPLRSGSTTSGPSTSNETSHTSPPVSPTLAPAMSAVLRPRQISIPDNHLAAVGQSSLPSPGTIESQINTVDTHRRKLSSDHGHLRAQPDASLPQHLMLFGEAPY